MGSHSRLTKLPQPTPPALYVSANRATVNSTLAALILFLTCLLAALIILLVDWQQGPEETYSLLFYALVALWLIWFAGFWVIQLIKFRKCHEAILTISELGVQDFTRPEPNLLSWDDLAQLKWSQKEHLPQKYSA